MNKIHINLVASTWSSNKDLYSRGTVFHNGNCFRSTNMINALSNLNESYKVWIQALLDINGFFAVLKQADSRLIAAVDRVRSIPLFYGIQGDRFYLSDDAEWVRQQVGDKNMDPIAREEFQLTGYVTGQETLFPNVRQLQAGEMLQVDAVEGQLQVRTHRYYRFLHTEHTTYDKPSLHKALDQSAEAAIRRLVEYADGRQIVIPLSGGYDSRLIAMLLCRVGYKNILTFTYGAPGNKESTYSRQVAKTLGLRWHFVEYSNKKWCTAWQTEEQRNYQRWASGWVSLPHTQDWLAVRELKANGVVEQDCVFTPGHSGDFVAGSHIPESAKTGSKADLYLLSSEIQKKHYKIAPWDTITQQEHAFWNERVLLTTEVNQIQTGEQLADAFEKWDWQERQAKFIVNSVRVYEFFGYDWWLPLWDAEFMRFWQEVPLALRKGEKWYIDYVRDEFGGMNSNGNGVIGHASDNNFIYVIKEIANFFRIENYVSKMKNIILSLALLDHASQENYNRRPAKLVASLSKKGWDINGIYAYFFLNEFDQGNS